MTPALLRRVVAAGPAAGRSPSDLGRRPWCSGGAEEGHR